ncbi:hypothetical protein [Halorubrum sp. PV6]|uniref:hypothetical protein n=1 Tax=Halorubrum sp. PV6 TaxID=634157 RepID=UPI000F8E4B29|nr:hypothetical protein [Halorubrum sp. PV6]
MDPSDAVAELAADPQIFRRLAATLTPPGMASTAGEAVALQLASAGRSSIDMSREELQVGYTATVPTSTASLCRHVRETCGQIATLGCEAATRAHAVGEPLQQGPQVDTEVRLTIYDAIAHATADLHMTIRRALTTGEVAVTSETQYTTQSSTGAVAVTHTRAASDQAPFDPHLAACLDFVVDLDAAAADEAQPTDQTAANPAPADCRPVPTARLDAYLTAVQETTLTVTSAAKERWSQYKQAADAGPAWTPPGSPSPIETVPKVAAALARLELADKVSADHTTTAIEWIETATTYSTVTDPCPDTTAVEHP